MADIKVYGASWCRDCRRSKEFLVQQRIEFEWVDLEAHPEAMADVIAMNDGKRVIPTIVFPDGSHLAEPSNYRLAEKLGIHEAARP
jgi:glutaredoxin